MKFIGQHIYDLIARFRSDIYLEGISTSTETDVLVVDSGNKVSKRAASGFTSGTATLASTVTVTDSTTNTDFPVVFHDNANALFDDTEALFYNPSTGTLTAPNLTVTGTTTTINTTNLEVQDKNIVLNYNASSDTSGTADGAGITIQDAVDASNDATILWTASSDTFTFSHNINATLATAAQTNITSLGTLTALTVDNITIDGDTITASADMALVATGNDITVDTDNFTIESATTLKPELTLKSTLNSNKPTVISHVKDKGVAGADGDDIGETRYTGDNDAQEQILFAKIGSEISDASDGAEEGKFFIGVANSSAPSDSSVVNALILEGNGANTDATIGYGTGSTTTTAGRLEVTGTLAVGANATFSSSTTDLPDVTLTNTTDDATGPSLILKNMRDSNGLSNNDVLGSINFDGTDNVGNAQSYAKLNALALNVTNSDEAGYLELSVATSNGSTSVLRNVITGYGSGSDSTVNVSIAGGSTSTTTISGTLTMGTTATLNNTGEIQVASQPNITTLAGVSAIGTAGTPITITSDAVTFQSASADDPMLKLINTTNDDEGARLIIQKMRADDAVASGQNVGEIVFRGQDDGQADEDYAQIIAEIDVSTHGQESGKITHSVAAHDGGNHAGLILQGGSESGEVDVTVAKGTASTTTIAGLAFCRHLTVNSDGHECLVLNTDGNPNNNPFMAFEQDGTRRAFIQHNDTDNTLKLASEYGNVQVLAAASAGSDGDTAYMQVTAGGTFRFGAVDNDAILTADGNMTFRIDADNDETGQSFAFQNNASTEIANLNESGDLQIDGKLTCASRTLAVTSATDGDHDGDVVYFGGTTSMTTGAIYHYKSDGTWELADADDNTKSDGLLGVALGSASDTNGVLLRGMVTIDHDPGAIGDVLYLTTTAGDCSATAPSGSGNIVRVIGYQVSHASNGNIWFNPDSTFVEIA